MTGWAIDAARPRRPGRLPVAVDARWCVSVGLALRLAPEEVMARWISAAGDGAPAFVVRRRVWTTLTGSGLSDRRVFGARSERPRIF